MATLSDARATWNERFAGSDYHFGEAPNAFLNATAMRYLKPGEHVLCVADGEGRNSVWLAEQGVRVTAFDIAPNGVDKARALAARRSVTVDYRVSDILAWRFEPASVDALVAIFIQFLGPAEREALFPRMKEAVKPGGHFLLEGYRPEQIGYATGGPRMPENLYTKAWVEATFRDWDVLELRTYDAVLAEGTAHAGMSAVIDLVARRPG